MEGEALDRRSFVKSLAIVAIPLLVILLVADAALHGQKFSEKSRQGVASFDPLTLGFVCFLVLGFLFYELKRHGERAAKLVVAGVNVSGTLAGLILLQAWFASSYAALGLFYLVAPPLAYVGVYLSFRDYTGSLSRKRAGILRALSVTILGAVLGTFLPEFFIIPFLVLLSVLDPLFVETNMLRRTLGSASFNNLTMASTLPMVGIDVGIGDLMAYSTLSATTIVNLGIFAALATTLLILVGVVLTIRVAEGRQVVSGLPIPLWLGLVPSIFLLLVP